MLVVSLSLFTAIALGLGNAMAVLVVKRSPAKGGIVKINTWMRNSIMMNKGMKALKKEAPEVAKKMGYSYGGMAKKKMGYKDGGLACGASNPAERPMKKGK